MTPLIPGEKELIIRFWHMKRSKGDLLLALESQSWCWCANDIRWIHRNMQGAHLQVKHVDQLGQYFSCSLIILLNWPDGPTLHSSDLPGKHYLQQ